jgi:hypothetical protein
MIHKRSYQGAIWRQGASEGASVHMGIRDPDGHQAAPPTVPTSLGPGPIAFHIKLSDVGKDEFKAGNE